MKLFNICFQLLFGIVSGFFLGKYFFKKVHYRGPNSNEVRNTVFQTEDDQYVMFDVEMCLCPPSAKNLFKEKSKIE